MLSIAIAGAAALLVSGCGSSTETAQGGNSSSPASATNSQAVNVSVPVDANVVNNPALAANGANANNGISQASNISELKQGKLDKLREGSDGPGVMHGMQPLKRPAPDNSEYWSTLTDKATETRVFKTDPYIARVEKVSDGTTSTVTITLRSGKAVRLPGDRVRNMSSEPVSTFMALAGVKAQQPAQPAGPPPEKKERPVNIFPKVN